MVGDILLLRPDPEAAAAHAVDGLGGAWRLLVGTGGPCGGRLAGKAAWHAVAGLGGRGVVVCSGWPRWSRWCCGQWSWLSCFVTVLSTVWIILVLVACVCGGCTGGVFAEAADWRDHEVKHPAQSPKQEHSLVFARRWVVVDSQQTKQSCSVAGIPRRQVTCCRWHAY